MEKLKLKEAKLLTDARKMAQPERDSLQEIKVKIKNLSKSLPNKDTEEEQELDKVFLEKHGELSRLINSVSKWGERKLQFDATLGSIEVIECSDGLRKGSESEDSPEVEMRKRAFKVKLMWNRCPHPCGVAEAPWKDALVDDQLIYIAASDSKMIIGIER